MWLPSPRASSNRLCRALYDPTSEVMQLLYCHVLMIKSKSWGQPRLTTHERQLRRAWLPGVVCSGAISGVPTAVAVAVRDVVRLKR